MLIVLIKTVITAAAVFLAVRLMGKRQIGEMQPFEFVITMLLAEVASLPMHDPAIPVYPGIVPRVTLAFLGIVPAFLCRRRRALRRLADGSSVLVVDGRGISAKNIARLNMSVDDVVTSCRSCGYPDLSLVAYAIAESNGKFSVVPKAGGENCTVLPLPLAEDGKPIRENMERCGMDDKALGDVLRGCKGMKDVQYMDIRPDGTVYVSPASSPCYTRKTRVKGVAP